MRRSALGGGIFEKIYDGIIGLAIGDAMGVPVEIKNRQDMIRNPVVSMREYGAHNLCLKKILILY